MPSTASATNRNLMKLADASMSGASARSFNSRGSTETTNGFFAKLSQARKEVRPNPTEQPEPRDAAPVERKPAKNEGKSNKTESSRESSRTRSKADAASADDDAIDSEMTTKPADSSAVDDAATVVDDTATDDATADDTTDQTDDSEKQDTDSTTMVIDPSLLAIVVPTDTVELSEAVTTADAESALVDEAGGQATAKVASLVKGATAAGTSELLTGGELPTDVEVAGVDGAIELPELAVTGSEPPAATKSNSAATARTERHQAGKTADNDAVVNNSTNAATTAVVVDTSAAVTENAVGKSTVPTTEALADFESVLNSTNLANNPAAPRLAGDSVRQAAPVSQTRMPTDAEFVQANHAKIVGAMTGGATATGGSMQIRLDPPHLGPMAVSIHMRDGMVTASFETQNDEATRLLSHSLGQLKTSLEAQGISVDRLQVQQAPKEQQADNDTRDQQKQSGQPGTRDALSDQQQQQQRQREETLRRMWSRINGDPIDLVA